MPGEGKNRVHVEQACVEFESDLRAFLLGVLKDRHLAEDALQQSILKAIQASETVQLETLRGWLFRIALNEAREIRRVQNRTQDVLKKAAWRGLSSNSGDGEDVVAKLLDQETRELFQNAVNRLPEDLRQIVVLRISRNQTFADIAKNLGVPLGTVLARMQRAIKQLENSSEVKSLRQ